MIHSEMNPIALLYGTLRLLKIVLYSPWSRYDSKQVFQKSSLEEFCIRVSDVFIASASYRSLFHREVFIFLCFSIRVENKRDYTALNRYRKSFLIMTAITDILDSFLIFIHSLQLRNLIHLIKRSKQINKIYIRKLNRFKEEELFLNVFLIRTLKSTKTFLKVKTQMQT